jgi:predicted ATPase
MQESLASLNDELERRFGTTVALRIGVNTGEVVAGDSSSRQTLVTGDAVNVAVRLEEAAGAGEIVIGETTYRLVRDAVTVAPAQLVPAKGKSEPVIAYRLLSLVRNAPPRKRRLDTQMVGRQEEMRALEDAFGDAITTRRAVMVTMVGEPGVGKSRLADELISKVAGQARVLGGRCLSYGEGITFWALAEMVREAAGFLDEETQEQARARLGTLLAGDDDGVRVAECIAQAIGLARGAASADEIAWAIRRLFETLARRLPLLLLVDDIQWAEPTFLDVLVTLVQEVQEAPILLVCLARPELLEKRAAWEATIRLEPLEGADVDLLIEDLLGEATLSPDARKRIAAAAEGNPLFAQELLAMLIDEGLLRRENGEWLPTQDLADVAIPPSLKALLAARLERLQPRQRAALERGSIEGQVFHRGAVVELSPVEAHDDVLVDLQALVEKEFVLAVEPSFVGEAAFRFRHILIRDAAYAAVPKKLRAELHERFATWLERKSSERIAELEEILGYHLEQAYLYRRELGPVDLHGRDLARAAARHLAAGGQRALARGDLPAARNLFSRTSAILPPGDPIRLTLLPDRGAALGYQLESEYRRRAALGTVDEQTRELGRTAAQRLSSAGRRALARGDMPAAVNLFAKASSLLPQADVLRRELLPDLIVALTQSGELDRAAQVIAETWDLAESCGDSSLKERVLPFRSRVAG